MASIDVIPKAEPMIVNPNPGRLTSGEKTVLVQNGIMEATKTKKE